VGGLVGGVLAQEGDQVTLLVRPRSFSQHPNSIFLDPPSGHSEVRVHVDTKFTGHVDVLWIAVKAYQLAAAIDLIPTNDLEVAATRAHDFADHANAASNSARSA
jgi:ketopantoate reductase